MAAVVEQDADGVEDNRDVVGQSGGGVILRELGEAGPVVSGRSLSVFRYYNWKGCQAERSLVWLAPDGCRRRNLAR